MLWIPCEHHANVLLRSVIGNLIFAVSDWFLKSKKMLVAETHSDNALDLRTAFPAFTGLDFVKTLAFPKLIQIPKMGLGDSIKVLKALIIVPPLLTF